MFLEKKQKKMIFFAFIRSLLLYDNTEAITIYSISIIEIIIVMPLE